MILTEEILQEIKKIYESTNDNVHGVGLGFKYVDNQQTEEISICFDVLDKKPISELDPSEIIPSSVMINGVSYSTDVKESTRYSFAACYTSDSDPEILRLRGDPQLESIKGGQEIYKFPTGFISQGGFIYTEKGTLGFCAIDNFDNTIVGITNAHVVVPNLLLASDRIKTKTTEPIENLSQQELNTIYTELGESGASTTDLIVSNLFGGNSYYPGGISLDASSDNFYATCPRIKRHIPLTLYNDNSTDCAVLFLNPNWINNLSYQMHKPTTEIEYVAKLPFASSSEINSLLSTRPKIYTTGRTTGPKGWGNLQSCQIDVLTIGLSVPISYGEFNLNFDNSIAIKYKDNSPNVIQGGDSGSVVLAEFNGVRKIIGLVYAANASYGLVCRIDLIQSALNIRAWDDSYVFNTNDYSENTGSPWDGVSAQPAGSNILKQKVLTIPYADSRSNDTFITISGVTYYQAGCTTNNNPEYESI